MANGKSASDAASGWLQSEPGLMADFAHCAELTRRASTNFYYAFFLLPEERRAALYSVYAFCRSVDDVADGEANGRTPEQQLAHWRRELDRAYSGDAGHPVSRALGATVRRFRIPKQHFEEIVAGVEMDLVRMRYQTFEELLVYCRRVASAVGLACIEIFGYRNPSAREYADRLGIALQLTNILRDVGEDARRGRIYLPREDLERFGVSETEILTGEYSSGFERLMEFEAARTRSYYEAAERALAPEDRAALLSAEAMRVIYSAILDELVRWRFRVFERRLGVSLARKLILVGRLWASSHLGVLQRLTA